MVYGQLAVVFGQILTGCQAMAARISVRTQDSDSNDLPAHEV